jgi:hypothetical protein
MGMSGMGDMSGMSMSSESENEHEDADHVEDETQVEGHHGCDENMEGMEGMPEEGMNMEGMEGMEGMEMEGEGMEGMDMDMDMEEEPAQAPVRYLQVAFTMSAQCSTVDPEETSQIIVAVFAGVGIQVVDQPEEFIETPVEEQSEDVVDVDPVTTTYTVSITAIIDLRCNAIERLLEEYADDIASLGPWSVECEGLTRSSSQIIATVATTDAAVAQTLYDAVSFLESYDDATFGQVHIQEVTVQMTSVTDQPEEPTEVPCDEHPVDPIDVDDDVDNEVDEVEDESAEEEEEEEEESSEDHSEEEESCEEEEEEEEEEEGSSEDDDDDEDTKDVHRGPPLLLLAVVPVGASAMIAGCCFRRKRRTLAQDQTVTAIFVGERSCSPA